LESYLVAYCTDPQPHEETNTLPNKEAYIFSHSPNLLAYQQADRKRGHFCTVIVSYHEHKIAHEISNYIETFNQSYQEPNEENVVSFNFSDKVNKYTNNRPHFWHHHLEPNCFPYCTHEQPYIQAYTKAYKKAYVVAHANYLCAF
jgi:hypothetical protein